MLGPWTDFDETGKADLSKVYYLLGAGNSAYKLYLGVPDGTQWTPGSDHYTITTPEIGTIGNLVDRDKTKLIQKIDLEPCRSVFEQK